MALPKKTIVDIPMWTTHDLALVFVAVFFLEVVAGVWESGCVCLCLSVLFVSVCVYSKTTTAAIATATVTNLVLFFYLEALRLCCRSGCKSVRLRK